MQFYRNRLRNSCKQRCSGGFSNCSQKLRRPTDVPAEVLSFGLSGRTFRQKKHKANSKLYAIRSVKRNVHRDLLFKKDCRYEFITQLWGNFWASHGAAR